ncbi:hypothetical protein [Serratia marcescens]|uniref:hypothetical protein n=1 Tax=Serratia marcescens TaxID=615 RepID=UPI0023B7814D|nr:hypothetical protein [Serratia marcescens]
MHVHVDHHDCLEVAILRGPVNTVRRFADGVVTQRGVRFGNLQIIPIRQGHGHGHGPGGHSHG